MELRPPKLNLPEIALAKVIYWRPSSALVRTYDGKQLWVHNPYSSQVHRKDVLIAKTPKGDYTIVGIRG